MDAKVAKAMYGDLADQAPRKKKEAHCSWYWICVDLSINHSIYVDATGASNMQYIFTSKKQPLGSAMLVKEGQLRASSAPAGWQD